MVTACNLNIGSSEYGTVFSLMMLLMRAISMADAKVEPAPVFTDHMVLRVKCPEVPNPVVTRYGMKDWSVATVFNWFIG